MPLVIGIALPEAVRRQLAQVLGGTEAFLIVANVEQARAFLGAAAPPAVAAEFPDASPPGNALVLDSDRRMLRWFDREVSLTRLEHDFLRRLLGAPGELCTYERLHQDIWGNQHLGRGSDIHSVARRVRRKLARLEAAATIHAVRGVGFRLARSAAADDDQLSASESLTAA